jgi:hypothetical protein
MAMREKSDSETLRLEALAAAASRSDFEERFEALRLEFASATRTGNEAERRLEYDRREFERRIDRGQRQLLEQVDKWTVDLNISLEKELKAHEQRLYKEIRSELSAELQKQKETISALDEHLWLTDKRLGNKIEDLVQSVTVVEKVALKDKRLDSGRRESTSPLGAEIDRNYQQDALWNAAPKTQVRSNSPRDVSAAVARTLAETVGDRRGDGESYSLESRAATLSKAFVENIETWSEDDGIDEFRSAVSNIQEADINRLTPSRRAVGGWRGKLAISHGSKARNQDVLLDTDRRSRLPVPPLQGLLAKSTMLAVEGFVEKSEDRFS